MWFFDVHKLDFRLPWTRAMDRTGDIAILGLKRTLSLGNLHVDRRRAIEIAQPSVVPWTGTTRANPMQHIERDIHRSGELLMMLSMLRNTHRDGVNWKIDISIFGHNIMYKRQQLRVAQAVRDFAATQSHLHDLVVTSHTDHIRVTLTAQIGDFAEPA